MNLATIAVKSIGRNKFRTASTILGVAVAILTFVLLRTVIWSWTAGVEHGAEDRVAVRHSMALILKLPKRYIEDVRAIPGVTAAAYANFFDGKDPQAPNDFFASVAAEPEDMLKVFDELVVDPARAQAWKENHRGALVGDALARRRGWKVGDRVTLQGTTYPGDWEFVVSAIYSASRPSVDRSTFYFHWRYLNDSLSPAQQDEVSWISARVQDPGVSAEVCRRIDARFDAREVQTLCMSERAIQASFLGMLSAVLKAIDVVSVVILVIMGLILGNTMAMGVRERTQEYGVLRALGFPPDKIVVFIMGEALALGALGGLIGLTASYPVVEWGIGRFLEENVGTMFPFFRIQPATALRAVLIALLLSAGAAALPAYRTLKMDTIEALRRVG